MRTLDCGCEVSDDGNTLLSMCSMHAGHMRARQAVERTMNKDTARMPDSERELRRDLVKLLAPVVLAKWTVITDPESSAEMLFQHINAIVRRTD